MKTREYAVAELKKVGVPDELLRIESYKPGAHRLYALFKDGTKLSPYLPAKEFVQFIDGFTAALKFIANSDMPTFASVFLTSQKSIG